MSYCQLLQTLNAISEYTDAKAPSKISEVHTAEEKNRIEIDRLEKSGLTNLQVYSSQIKLTLDRVVFKTFEIVSLL